MAEDNHVYGFSVADALTILHKTGEGGGQAVRLHTHPQNSATAGRIIHFKAPGGGIPAPTGLTMGSASCDRYDSTSAGVLSDSGVNVTVYNDGPAYPASSYGIAAKNSAGLWVVARGIMNLRLDGNNLQLTFDGITWVTWHTGVNCP